MRLCLSASLLLAMLILGGCKHGGAAQAPSAFITAPTPQKFASSSDKLGKTRSTLQPSYLALRWSCV
jgi:hypothetical protein